MEINNNYGRGFIYKCAELGIDPLALVDATASEVKQAGEDGGSITDELGGIKDSVVGTWEDLDEGTKEIVLTALAGGALGTAGGGIIGAATTEKGESMGENALYDALIGGAIGAGTAGGGQAIYQALDGNEDGSLLDEGSALLDSGKESLQDLISGAGNVSGDVQDKIRELLSSSSEEPLLD